MDQFFWLFLVLGVLGSILLISVILVLWYGVYFLVRKYIFEEGTEKKKAIIVTTMLVIFLTGSCFNKPIIDIKNIENILPAKEAVK